jgi:hypothetical protein
MAVHGTDLSGLPDERRGGIAVLGIGDEKVTPIAAGCALALGWREQRIIGDGLGQRGAQQSREFRAWRPRWVGAFR